MDGHSCGLRSIGMAGLGLIRGGLRLTGKAIPYVASRGETSPAPTGRHMNSRRIARGALGSLRGDHDVGLREITALEEKRLPGSLGQRV